MANTLKRKHLLHYIQNPPQIPAMQMCDFIPASLPIDSSDLVKGNLALNVSSVNEGAEGPVSLLCCHRRDHYGSQFPVQFIWRDDYAGTRFLNFTAH